MRSFLTLRHDPRVGDLAKKIHALWARGRHSRGDEAAAQALMIVRGECGDLGKVMQERFAAAILHCLDRIASFMQGCPVCFEDLCRTPHRLARLVVGEMQEMADREGKGADADLLEHACNRVRLRLCRQDELLSPAARFIEEMRPLIRAFVMLDEGEEAVQYLVACRSRLITAESCNRVGFRRATARALEEFGITIEETGRDDYNDWVDEWCDRLRPHLHLVDR